jgi:hypothetical protein
MIASFHLVPLLVLWKCRGFFNGCGKMRQLIEINCLQGFRRPAAGRIDIEGVLLRQQGRLDLELVFAELMPLSVAKESPEIVYRLRSLTGLMG